MAAETNQMVRFLIPLQTICREDYAGGIIIRYALYTV